MFVQNARDITEEQVPLRVVLLLRVSGQSFRASRLKSHEGLLLKILTPPVGLVLASVVDGPDHETSAASRS